MKILDKYTKDELINLLDNSISFRGFLLKIGSSFNGSSAYNSIKKQLTNLGIEIPKYKKITNQRFDRLSDDEVFIENSKYSRYHLKLRIIKYKIIKYKCNVCENFGSWKGEKLSLQLEHKNGINNDNRIENLCFLCPNCHSQTDTYSGKKLKNRKQKDIKKIVKKERNKNKCICGSEIHRTSQKCSKCAMNSIRKVNRPEYMQLLLDIEELGYCGTGRKYGVSDNSIRKWIKKYEDRLR